jgi:predicted transcriptional regulator
MPKPKGSTSYRLSDDAQGLLARLADRLGLSKTSVMEMAIRKLAYAEFGEAGSEPQMVGVVSSQEKPSGLRPPRRV